VPSHLHTEPLIHAPLLILPADSRSDTRPTAELFRGLSQEHVASILAAATLRRLVKGHIVTRSGEPATHLFQIKTGLVNFYRVTREGREVLLSRLSEGEAFGLGTLLDKPVNYLGNAETITETELYVWEHSWVLRFAKKEPTLALNALRIALEYIRLSSERHLALVSEDAEDRLTSTLMQLGIRTGHQHPRGLEVQITNEHLASLADVGYFTASRLLSKWQHKGALEKSRGKIIIHCPEKMLT
jgi:CRP-like cAMP-binding protein